MRYKMDIKVFLAPIEIKDAVIEYIEIAFPKFKGYPMTVEIIDDRAEITIVGPEKPLQIKPKRKYKKRKKKKKD